MQIKFFVLLGISASVITVVFEDIESLAQSISPEVRECIANFRRELGVSADAALTACLSPNVNTQQVIKPVTSAESYWVYEKPSNVSDSQMQSAGARFYSGHQACSIHYSLCTNLSGVWLSQQQSLVIKQSQTPSANSQTQAGSPLPSPSPSPVSSPRTDTDLYLTYYRECMDRTMYRTLKAYDRAIAVNGYNMGYQYGRKPSDISKDQMKKAGLRWNWTFQSWISSQPEVKIPMMESAQVSQLCKNELENVKHLPL